ncbi:restriction endonuclease subunit S [Pseudomonas syringae]|uniref:restriction endonuclease subunit S n=1 Tax=Pseudomonas syringae TaxID=317 RepID=UPI001BCC4CBF|nr:restriction endonuclease subunit S [Pseudomonas syringae]MBS7471867.1 restriction endonuclease subunit S [Pseudomonas syringae]
MTALLTDNLPLLVGAPNGIKKLRELILELAVRGKLVPQNANDEPAGELLKRISEGKAGLLAAGKIKNESLLGIAGKERLFQLPSAWEWCTLSALLPDFQNGVSSRGDANGVNATVLRLADIKLGEISLEDTRILTLDATTFRKHRLEAGDLLLIRVNGSAELVGRFIVCRKELHAIPCDHFIRMRLPKDVIDSGYLKIVGDSESVRRIIAGLFVSTAGQKTVNQGHIGSLPIPLPPLDQQRRIVTKVNELMVLCDRLEAQQSDATTAHAQLVRALLESLTQASDATDFATNWQRLAEHFHTLFTTEPSIDALKQTLLQLAVMGKLVQQDPNDEPASELLKRVAEEKVRLVAEGKFKKQKPLAGIEDDEVHFDLPSSWAWTRFGNICAIKGELVRPEDFPSLRQIAPDCIEKGTGRLTDNRTVKDSGVKGPNSRFFAGQIVYSKIRPSLSKAVLVDFDGLCSADMYPIDAFICPEFLLKEILSEVFLKQVRIAENRIKMPKLNQESLTSFVLPIPPLAEQHRIVAKVDQLMALCDQLKISLTQARQLNAQLACTLVERSLAEDSQQGPKATYRQIARTLLAAEVTHRLHSQRTFGQRKLQKVIYLVEHVARLNAIQGDYLRDAAGPHDRQLMTKVEAELQNHQWYERFERETIGHAYRPLSQAGRHRQAYSSAWSVAERATIEQVIELMRDWDTDRCEMTVTLYAAWNDFILEGRPVTDEAIVDEVMHSWNDTKLRFGKTEWLAVLAEMKKHKILMPTGFGKRTKGGMLSLPGFE